MAIFKAGTIGYLPYSGDPVDISASFLAGKVAAVYDLSPSGLGDISYIPGSNSSAVTRLVPAPAGSPVKVYRVVFTQDVSIPDAQAGVLGIAQPPYVAPPPSNFDVHQVVADELPFDRALITINQAPVDPILLKVLNGGDDGAASGIGEPDQYYGDLYNNPTVVEVFRHGSNTKVTALDFYNTRTQGVYGGPLPVYGILADRVNDDYTLVNPTYVLLCDYGGKVNGAELRSYPVDDAPYVGLMYQMFGTRAPNRIVRRGTSTALPPIVLPPPVKYPLKNAVGINLHTYTMLEDLDDSNVRGQLVPQVYQWLKILKLVRLYMSIEEFYQTRNQTQFNHSYNGRNLSECFRQPKLDGVHVIPVLEGQPGWQQQTYPIPGQYQGERIIVPSGADRLQPAAYNQANEIVDQFAGAFFANPLPANRLFFRTGPVYANAPQGEQYDTPQAQGTVDEIEIPNEDDRWWKGTESHNTPAQRQVMMASLVSRVKQLNPQVKIGTPGQASFTADQFKETGVGLYDVYKVHYYPATGGGQYSNSQTPQVGTCIELSTFDQLFNDWYRTSVVRGWNIKLSLEEVGYDCSTGSPLRAVVPAGAGYTQYQWAGVLLLRVALRLMKRGVWRVFHYNFFDDDPINQGTQFTNMGLFEVYVGSDGKKKCRPRPAGWLLIQLTQQLGEFVHHHEVSASPAIDEWHAPTGQVLRSYHMPTESNLTGSYVETIPAGGATLLQFSLSSATPQTSQLPAGPYQVRLTETPQFILFS